MKTADLRKKTTEELGTELLELRRAQFSLKMQLATQQLNKVCLLYTSPSPRD